MHHIIQDKKGNFDGRYDNVCCGTDIILCRSAKNSKKKKAKKLSWYERDKNNEL